MRVKNIMTKDVISIDKDQNVCDALRTIKKNKKSRLIVVNTNADNEKAMVGTMTIKDISMKLGSSKYLNMPPAHFHVSTVMTKDVLSIDEDMDVAEAANIMLEKHIGGLPVLDDEELVGILTKSDIIDTCQGKAYENKPVSDYMSTDIISVSPSDRLVHARRVMIDAKIGRLLVMDGEKLVGLLASKDISKAMISFRKVVPDKHQAARIRNLIVEDVMTQSITTVADDTSIADVAKLMLEKGVSGFPVSDENNNIVGLITKTDILELLVEMD